MLFSKETLPRPVFGLLADKYPDIFKKEKQIWYFDFVLLDLAFFFEMLGNILVEGRLWMALYRSCILLAFKHMLLPVLSSLILKSAGCEKEEKSQIAVITTSAIHY